MDARFEEQLRPSNGAERMWCLGNFGIILIIMVSFSCTPDPLDVDNLTFPETRIVVSSVILPDTSVAVLLTKSIGALEANEETDPRDLIADIAINDAEVTLTVNDSVYALKLLRDGVYQGID